MDLFKKFIIIFFITIIFYLTFLPKSFSYSIETSTLSDNVKNQIIDVVNKNYNWDDYGFYCGRFADSYILFVYNKNTYSNVGAIFDNYNGTIMRFLPSYEGTHPHYDTWYIDFNGTYNSKTRTNYEFPRNYADTVYNLSEYYLYGFPRNAVITPSVINPFYKLCEKLDNPPYFSTTQNQLQTFDFDYFTINGGTMPYKNEFPEGVENIAQFSLDYTYKGVRTVIDLSNYLTVNNDNTWSINIPYNALTNNVIVKNNEDFYYRFFYSLYGTNYNGSISIGGTYNLTSEQENNINEENNKQVLGQLDSNQKQTNERLDNLQQQQEQTNNNLNKVDGSINNMTNTMNDSNVDDSNVNDISNLSNSFNANDVSGIDQLFQVLYNAFCTNEIQQLVFTIPFTNKVVTINTNNISNNFPQEIKSIVAVFVWGIIGLWVLKDIRGMINKISEGNPENVGSDVKKEVL